MNSIERISAQNISRTYVQNADATQQNAARSDKAQQQQQRSQAPKTDSVSLSDSARSLASARHAVNNASDVREQKVADIKMQVESGTYNVSSRVLARKMLNQQTQSS